MSAANRLHSYMTIGAAAAILLLSFAVQMRWGTIPDTSWLLTVIDRLAAGDELYRDIIETNPPFSVWLYVPPYIAAQWAGISPELAVHLFTLAICLISAITACWVLTEGRLINRRHVPFAFIVLLALIILPTGNTFTERDHIGAVMVLPLFVLAAWRADRRNTVNPGMRHWLIAGSMASILSVVKPYYALVIVAAAVWLAVKRRNIRLVFLPEFVIAGAACIAYLVGIFFSYSAYFDKLLPLLSETYVADWRPMLAVTVFAYPAFFLVGAYLFIRRNARQHNLSDALFIGSLAAWIPYFIQGKGWAYHQYPAILLGSAALLAILAENTDSKGARSENRRLSAMKTVAILVIILAAHTRFANTEKPPAQTVEETVRAIDRPTVAMFGGDIAAAHPLTRMIGGRWIEPYCSDWIVIYAIRMAGRSAAQNDDARRIYYEEMARRYALEKKARLFANPPDVMLLDKSDSVSNSLFAETGLTRLLGSYDLITEDSRMSVYKRVRDVE